ncbi:hypothetical protein GGI43DRAFT_406237 [Trichoderma evansii]
MTVASVSRLIPTRRGAPHNSTARSLPMLQSTICTALSTLCFYYLYYLYHHTCEPFLFFSSFLLSVIDKFQRLGPPNSKALGFTVFVTGIRSRPPSIMSLGQPFLYFESLFILLFLYGYCSESLRTV